MQWMLRRDHHAGSTEGHDSTLGGQGPSPSASDDS
jgi:hypothetical protein